MLIAPRRPRCPQSAWPTVPTMHWCPPACGPQLPHCFTPFSHHALGPVVPTMLRAICPQCTRRFPRACLNLLIFFCRDHPCHISRWLNHLFCSKSTRTSSSLTPGPLSPLELNLGSLGHVCSCPSQPILCFIHLVPAPPPGPFKAGAMPPTFLPPHPPQLEAWPRRTGPHHPA